MKTWKISYACKSVIAESADDKVQRSLENNSLLKCTCPKSVSSSVVSLSESFALSFPMFC